MLTIKNKRLAAAVTLGFLAVPTVALAATDAVPGDPFKLGQDNRIVNASTIISGSGQKTDAVLQVRQAAGSGAAFKVVNQGAGIARGIDIDVQPGKPPISVPDDAGKATNLNADELDGRDEEDFIPSRLYGNGTQVLVDGPGGGQVFSMNAANANLKCDPGDIAINAGATAISPEDHLTGMQPFGGSYQFQFRDNGSPGKFKANIICADNARPFR